jgi:hypothetical protein
VLEQSMVLMATIKTLVYIVAHIYKLTIKQDQNINKIRTCNFQRDSNLGSLAMLPIWWRAQREITNPSRNGALVDVAII